MSDNYFADLYAVNVADKIEKKNGLSYLSWAWAWAELKKRHPSANAKVYENAEGWNYFTDRNTAWVKTGVTVNDIEHIEYLPVMDHRNKSIPLASITSFDVNKAIQRSMTKAIGRHGLGLSIYAGEDIPDAPAHEAPAPLDRDMVNTLAAITTKTRPNESPTKQERAPEKSDYPTARDECSRISAALKLSDDDKKELYNASSRNYSNLLIILKEKEKEAIDKLASIDKTLSDVWDAAKNGQ